MVALVDTLEYLKKVGAFPNRRRGGHGFKHKSRLYALTTELWVGARREGLKTGKQPSCQGIEKSGPVLIFQGRLCSDIPAFPMPCCLNISRTANGFGRKDLTV